ncbi:MAG: tetratricopeptide repeat protein [Treponema sp.]|nr:tetratricopeptide repeat protein [Treponema sp.]
MRLRIFLVFFLVSFSAFCQHSYNHNALEHLRESLEHLVNGDFNNAIISSNQLIRIDPNSAVNYVIRARALYELQEYDRVIADCAQAIRLDRNNAAAFTIRGNAYGQKGEYNRAISDWEAALRINPNIEEARVNIETARQRRDN